MTQIYYDKGQLPRRIILAADPWIFNANNGIDLWMSLSEEYKNINRKMKEDLSFAEYSKVVGYRLEKFVKLLSPGYFQKSFRFLLLSTQYLDQSKPVALGLAEVNQNGGLRFDGSVSEPGKDSRSPEEVHDVAISYANMDPISFMGRYDRIDPRLESHFRAYLKYMKDNRIEVIVLLVPFNPVAWKIMIARPQYRIIETVESRIRYIAEETNVRVAGSYDPAKAGVDENDFIDGAHPSESCMIKLLDGL